MPQEPGKDPSEASKVLLSATSEMDLWKGEVESGQGENRGGWHMMNDGNKKQSGSPPIKNSLFYICQGEITPLIGVKEPQWNLFVL